MGDSSILSICWIGLFMLSMMPEASGANESRLKFCVGPNVHAATAQSMSIKRQPNHGCRFYLVIHSLEIVIFFITYGFQPFRLSCGNCNVFKPAIFCSTMPVFYTIMGDNNITGF